MTGVTNGLMVVVPHTPPPKEQEKVEGEKVVFPNPSFIVLLEGKGEATTTGELLPNLLLQSAQWYDEELSTPSMHQA